MPVCLVPQQRQEIDDIGSVRQLPLPGDRVWRIAERDERLAGKHHE